MTIKLVRTDAADACKIQLPLGEHVFGRGKLLECDDKRISRQHGKLSVSDDSLTITALHQNPCFFIKKGVTDTEILRQNSTVTLCNGDRFGLLPDAFWYELIFCSGLEVSTNVDSEKNTEEYCVGNKEFDKTTSSETNQTALNNFLNSDDDFDTEMAQLQPSIVTGNKSPTPALINDSDTTNSNENVSDKTSEPCEIDPNLQNEPNVRNEPNVQDEPNVQVEPNVQGEPNVEDEPNVQSASNVQIEENVQNEPNVPSNSESNSSKRCHSPDICDVKKVKTEPVDVKTENSDDVKPGPSLDQAAAGGGAACANNAPAPRERCMYGASCYSEEIPVVVEPSRGPAKRCVFCGHSTGPNARRRAPPLRSYELTESFVASRPELLVYAQHLSTEFQISKHDRICRPCVQRAQRFYKKKEQEVLREQSAVSFNFEPTLDELMDCSRDPLSIIEQDPISDVPEEIVQELKVPKEVVQKVTQRVSQTESELVDRKEQRGISQKVPKRIAKTVVQTLPLEGYKRMSSSSTHCCIRDCTESDLHKIHMFIRAHVLIGQNVYIPCETCVCTEHLRSEVWRNISAHGRELHESFDGNQISDMLNLLGKRINFFLDFERIESIDDSVFEYLIGFGKSKFLKILEKIAPLKAKRNAMTNLAAVLTKLHTADSDDSLSLLFRMSKKQFERIITNFQSCVSKEI